MISSELSVRNSCGTHFCPVHCALPVPCRLKKRKMPIRKKRQQKLQLRCRKSLLKMLKLSKRSKKKLLKPGTDEQKARVETVLSRQYQTAKHQTGRRWCLSARAKTSYTAETLACSFAHSASILQTMQRTSDRIIAHTVGQRWWWKNE